MTTEKNAAPSAEDLGAVWATLGDWDVSSATVEAVAILIARVRREARAEAFEDARMACILIYSAIIEGGDHAGEPGDESLRCAKRFGDLAAKARTQ